MIERNYLQDVNDISVRRLELESLLTDGEISDLAIAGLYNQAIDDLKQKELELARSKDAQDFVANIGLETLTDIEEKLAQLDKISDLVPKDKVDRLKAQQAEKISSVISFFETYGVVSDSAETFAKKVVATCKILELEVAIVEVGDDEKSQSATAVDLDTNKQDGVEDSGEKVTPLFLGISDNFVTVGRKRNRKFYFSKTNHPSQRDYNDARRNALIYLLDNPTEEHSPYQIYASIYGEETPFDKRELVQIKVFFEKLTIRRGQKIIQTNGKRGQGSRYFVNPSIDVSYEYIEAEQGLDSKSTASEQDQSEEFQTPESLTLQESFFLTAHHLKMFDKFMATSNLPDFPDAVLEKLKKHAPDLSCYRGNKDMIMRFRRKAASTVKSIVTDGEMFDKFLDNMDQNSGEYLFTEWLSMLTEQQFDLVVDLFEATPAERPILNHRRLVGVEQVVLDAEGEEILPLISPDEMKKSLRSTSSSSPSVAQPTKDQSSAEEPEQEPHLLIEEGQVETTDSLSTGQLVSDEEKKSKPIAKTIETSKPKQQTKLSPERKKARVDWKVKFTEEVDGAVRTLDNWGLIVPGSKTVSMSTASLKSDSVKFATKEAIRRLKESGLISLEESKRLEHPLWVYVAMQVQNTNRQTLSRGPKQKTAKKIIEDACERALLEADKKS